MEHIRLLLVRTCLYFGCVGAIITDRRSCGSGAYTPQPGLTIRHRGRCPSLGWVDAIMTAVQEFRRLFPDVWSIRPTDPKRVFICRRVSSLSFQNLFAQRRRANRILVPEYPALVVCPRASPGVVCSACSAAPPRSSRVRLPASSVGSLLLCSREIR